VIAVMDVYFISFVIAEKNLRLSCHTVLFLLCNNLNELRYARAPPFSILKTYKIGKEKAKDGRKRKILYWTERTNL